MLIHYYWHIQNILHQYYIKYWGIQLSLTNLLMTIVHPNNCFDPWRKNIGVYNFADVNNHVRKKHIADNSEL